MTIQVGGEQDSCFVNPYTRAACRRAAASAEEFMLSGAIPQSLRRLLLDFHFLGTVQEWRAGDGNVREDLDGRRATLIVQGKRES